MQNNLNQLIKQIEEKIKIEEVVSNYVNLERKGNNYVGLCPFHADSNPSMSVSPQKGIFKCFSCQAGGNAITFVQNHEGIPFIEAVKKLADKANIDWRGYITENKRVIDPALKEIWDINKEAQVFFAYSLKTNKVAQEYAKNRNLTSEIIDNFNIGWSGDHGDLTNYLSKKGFSDDQIVKAGLGKINEEKVNTYFVQRLMFPIHDKFGNIIGFSGRVIVDSKYAKYLNTPETKAFVKGDFLYNFHRAQSPISLKGFAIIVEGFMDVIAYHKIGIKNVVATMGTAFTSNHNLLLKKSTKNYIFSFDNDEAGISATIKSGKAALSAEVKVKVAMPKGSKDIDEFLAKTSPEEVEANLAEAEDFISFLVDILFKASPTDPSFERIREVLSIVSKTNDELAKDYYVSKIANFYSIEKDVIATQLKNLTVKEHYEAEKKEIVKQRNSSDKVRINNLNARVLEQELEILSISLTDIEVFKVLQQNHYLFNSKLPKFFYNLIKANISDGVLNIEEIRKEIPKEDLLGAFNKLIITDDRETQIKIKELLLLINNTKDNVTELSKNNLLFEISNEDDPDKVDFLNKMLKEL